VELGLEATEASAVPARLSRAATVTVACAVAALLPIWTSKYLPMVDLPQHAAQLSIWQHLHDPAFGFEPQFELFWTQPYLLGYLVAMPLLPFIGVLTALKIVLSAYVLGLVAALYRLLAVVGGDRRLAIVGVPLAFGYSFCWGFYNFLVAVPLGILLVAEAYEHASAPSRRSVVRLVFLACLLYVAHLLVLGVAGLIAGLVIVCRARPLRALPLRLLPLAVPVPAMGLWLYSMMRDYAQNREPTIWVLDLERIREMPGTMLGYPLDRDSLLMAVLLVGAVVLMRPRPARRWARWIPALVAAAMFLAGPYRAFGTFFVYQRAAQFAGVFLLAALDPPVEDRRQSFGFALLVVLVVSWIGIQGMRFNAFDSEARAFDDVKAQMEPNKRAVAVTFQKQSDFVPGMVYLHFLAWYQAEKGGVLGFSFGSFSGMLARYRSGAEPRMTHGLEWFPAQFSWRRDGTFDYYVVRAPADVGPILFRDAGGAVRLKTQSGPWWLYERHSP
jgi:hypothetical protein